MNVNYVPSAHITMPVEEDGEWSERFVVELRPIRPFEAHSTPRFAHETLLVNIAWDHGTKKQRNGTQLRPMTVAEFRQFVERCQEFLTRIGHL